MIQILKCENGFLVRIPNYIDGGITFPGTNMSLKEYTSALKEVVHGDDELEAIRNRQTESEEEPKNEIPLEQGHYIFKTFLEVINFLKGYYNHYL